MKLFLILSFLLYLPSSLAESKDQEEQQRKQEHAKVLCLLEQIERSKAVFVRNGSQHTSAAARRHLEFKYNKVTKKSLPFRRPKNLSAQDFIDKIASKSSFSGKDYHMIIDNKTVTTKLWLDETLKNNCSKRP